MASAAPPQPAFRVLAFPISCVALGAMQYNFPDLSLFPGVPGGAFILPITLMTLSTISLRILSRIQKMQKNVGQKYSKILVPLHILNLGVQSAAIYRIHRAPAIIPPWAPEPLASREKRIQRAFELAEKYHLIELKDEEDDSPVTPASSATGEGTTPEKTRVVE